MLKRWSAVIVPTLALASIAPAALATEHLSGTYTTKITRPASLKGLWAVKFAAGADTVSVNGHPLIHGNYTISGSTITLKSRGTGTCTSLGKYTFTLSGETLKFTKINDPCPGRPEVLAHSFTKV
jgi:hypothetical protein